MQDSEGSMWQARAERVVGSGKRGAHGRGDGGAVMKEPGAPLAAQTATTPRSTAPHPQATPSTAASSCWPAAASSSCWPATAVGESRYSVFSDHEMSEWEDTLLLSWESKRLPSRCDPRNSKSRVLSSEIRLSPVAEPRGLNGKYVWREHSILEWRRRPE